MEKLDIIDFKPMVSYEDYTKYNHKKPYPGCFDLVDINLCKEYHRNVIVDLSLHYELDLNYIRLIDSRILSSNQYKKSWIYNSAYIHKIYSETKDRIDKLIYIVNKYSEKIFLLQTKITYILNKCKELHKVYYSINEIYQEIDVIDYNDFIEPYITRFDLKYLLKDCVIKSAYNFLLHKINVKLWEIEQEKNKEKQLSYLGIYKNRNNINTRPYLSHKKYHLTI